MHGSDAADAPCYAPPGVGELWHKSRWLLLGAAVVALALWLMSELRSPEVPRDALSAAPSGSSVVARIDVGALTSSHLWRALLAQDEEERGVRRVERVCGYDPLDEVDDAVVFVFGGSARPFEHIGFIARGPLARGSENRRRLLSCVGDVVGGAGGVRRVEIEGEPAIASSSGESHAAFLGTDGVVGGDREVVARVIRVARGDGAPAGGDPTLRRLWARVSRDRDIVAVANLPARWIPALRRMSRGLEGDLGALASLRALGLGARVRGGLSAGLAAETADATGARQLAALVRAQVDGLLAEPLVGLSAFGRALRRIEVDAQEHEVIVTLSLSNAQLDDVLELWRELRASDDGDARVDAVSAEAADGGEAAAAGEEAPDVEASEVQPARAPATGPEDAREDETGAHSVGGRQAEVREAEGDAAESRASASSAEPGEASPAAPAPTSD